LGAPTNRAEADRLEGQAHVLLARGHELLARAAELRAGAPSADPSRDDLIPIAEVPLDARTRLRLEREGRLPVEKLGRRKFTRRSALAALVGGVTPSPAPDASRRDPRESARALYMDLVAGRPSPARLKASGASKG
jgi:hypothetical protein